MAELQPPAGAVTAAGRPDATGLQPFRRRALRVGVLTRLLVVGIMAVAVLAQEDPNPRLTALVVLITVDVAYLITRVPWEELLHRPSGTRWLYTWSVVDIALVTLGVAITGGAHSELFLLYALAIVLFAVTYPPRGQAALLALTAAGYLGVLALDDWDTTLAACVVRLGGLALVAYVANFLSRELLVQAAASAEARAESESRATLLAVVAEAARTMSTLDRGEVLGTVVTSALQLGFDGAEVCLFDEQAGTWRVARARGVSPEPAPVGALDTGAAGLVHGRRQTVVLDEHSGWPLGVRPALDAGYRFLVGSPIWSGGDLSGALVAGSLTRTSPYPHEVECMDLLASHAGAALGNAAIYVEQAFHDDLTGLPNRALFLDRLEQALARTRRDGEPLGVLFMDLDRFKAINDNLGHDRGDDLLAAVAQRLQACLRPGDTLARYGGDEFCVLLEKLRSDDDGIDVADRLLKALEDPFSLAGTQLAVSASIGVSFAKAPFVIDPDPLREADQAMYRAKERGKGRWEVYRSEMNIEAVNRMELEGQLRAALDRGELRLAYQPVVDLATSRIVGVEALARWRHPTRGEVGPARFVPIAERSGLSLRLGAWVLEQACRQVTDWEREGLPALHLHVNITLGQLASVDLADQVAEILGITGLAPGRLTLETHEEAIIGRGMSVSDSARRIGRLGVRLGIDDFGRGYSALRQLKLFPVHAVKVDRSLVQGVADDAGDLAVVRSLVVLAGELGIRVAAHGVETRAQLEQLRALGCSHAQGFLFSPPISGAAMADLLRAPDVPAPAP
ncbi:MAG: putative bifunctional diguanylate cyclase/phosphodiesterase [Acidimicrobiales bacterium]